MERAHRLLFFSDYVCPYCYLADCQLARVRERSDVAFDMAAYELRPVGTDLPSPDAAWLRHAWRHSVRPLAQELGVTIREPVLMTRTRKAHEAVAYARSEGVAVAMHESVFRAYWQDGRDIGRIDVLVEIGAGVGLDRSALKVALDIDRWTERVLDDEQLAERLRLSAVPAYVLQDGGGRTELRIGLQRAGEMDNWLGAGT